MYKGDHRKGNKHFMLLYELAIDGSRCPPAKMVKIQWGKLKSRLTLQIEINFKILQLLY